MAVVLVAQIAVVVANVVAALAINRRANSADKNDEHHENGKGWADDVFVGPRASYVISDPEGDCAVPLACPMNEEVVAIWAGQVASGPHGSEPENLLGEEA